MDESKNKTAEQAYEAAVKYLAASARSEKEVRERLYKKGFHKQEVEAAIEKAKGYRYIDDEAYVENFVRYYSARYGRKKIAYKLSSEKGIDIKIADCAVLDYISDEEEADKAANMARTFIKNKKLDRGDGARKVWAFLYQRGFENDVIRRTVDNLFDDCDGDF